MLFTCEVRWDFLTAQIGLFPQGIVVTLRPDKDATDSWQPVHIFRRLVYSL